MLVKMMTSPSQSNVSFIL